MSERATATAGQTVGAVDIDGLRLPLIVHSHIPKTGGSALNNRLFYRWFPLSQQLGLYRLPFTAMARFAPEGDGKLSGKRFVSGHIPVGYFDNITSAIYVSLYRDPVERILSFASFAVASKDHGALKLFDTNLKPLAKSDPDRFLRVLLGNNVIAVRQFNLMTRLSAGRPFLTGDATSDDDLTVALTTLGRPDFRIGLQEAFDKFVLQLRFEFNWNGPEPNPSTLDVPLDVVEKRLDFRIRQSDLRSSTVDWLRAEQTIDLRFYELVARRVEERSASLVIGAASESAAS
ncbi:MAG TPA: hypothetical protein VFB16_02250 [Bauldia sp.]|nr:hypothetical protein [Bauldia sp.]